MKLVHTGQQAIHRQYRAAAKWARYAVPVLDNDIHITNHGNGNRTVHIPELNFQFEIRKTAQGKSVLHYSLMSSSDIHLGTRQSRAKRKSLMLEHTTADTHILNGDIVDIEHMLKKLVENLAVWHVQVLAHFFRKAQQGSKMFYLPGNHDIAVRNQSIIYRGQDVELGGYKFTSGKRMLHRNLCGKTFQNIRVAEEQIYEDPKGKKVGFEHGDKFDQYLFGKNSGFWYHLGSAAYDGLIEVDLLFQQIPRCENVSIAAIGKRVTKTIINQFLGVRRAMTKLVDHDHAIDGKGWGHEHMEFIGRTRQGKLLINSGCCTEHVQATVHDINGTWANIEWHSDRMIIKAENSQVRTIYWKTLGVDFNQEPTMYDDEFVGKAQKVRRILARLAPSVERQQHLAKAEVMRRDVSREQGALLVSPPMLPKIQRSNTRPVQRLVNAS